MPNPLYTAIGGSVVSHPTRHQSSGPQAIRHHAPAVRYFSGHKLRNYAQDAGVEDPFSSSWYPGLEIYRPSESVPVGAPVQYIGLFLAQQTNASLAFEPTFLHQQNGGASPKSLRLSGLPVNRQYTTAEPIYELPAHDITSQPTSSQLQCSFRGNLDSSNSVLSSFQQEFCYMRSLIAPGGANVAPMARPPAEEKDITYLARHIIRGTTPDAPIIPPSPILETPTSRPTHSSAETHSLPSSTPFTPGALLPTETRAPAVASNTFATPPPPLFPKPQAYRNGAFQGACSNGIEARDTTMQLQDSPPPLPTKPSAYQPFGNRVCVNAKHGSSMTDSVSFFGKGEVEAERKK